MSPAACRSGRVVLHERRQRADGVERVAGEVDVVRVEPVALGQRRDQLDDGQRVELGHRAEQWRVLGEVVGPVLDAEDGRDDPGDLGYRLAHTSTSTGAGWPKKAVGLAVSP